MTEGIKEALNHEEARVFLEKRKEIPPPDKLTSKAGLDPKRRKKSKVKSKAQAAAPTPDNPVVM